MSASYGQDLEVIHRCGGKEMLLTEARNDTEADDDDTHGNNTSGIAINCDKADIIFFDYKESDPEPERTEHLQRIQNVRNKDRVRTLNGEILHYNGCSGTFSATEIVNMTSKESTTSLLCHDIGSVESGGDIFENDKITFNRTLVRQRPMTECSSGRVTISDSQRDRRMSARGAESLTCLTTFIATKM